MIPEVTWPLDPFEQTGRGLTPRLESYLAEQPRTPVVAVDLAVVQANFAALREALPEADVHYAVKANPAPEVVSRLTSLGAGMDVASAREIALCLALGVPAARPSYGNPVKRPADIAFAHAHGVQVFSVDCLEELDKVTRCAPGSLVNIRLATSSTGARWPMSRKFGCGPATTLDLMHRAQHAGHDVGVTFHVGFQQLRPTAWDEALHPVAPLVERFANRGVACAY